MAIVSIHLISLAKPETLPSLLKYIQSSNVKPLTLAKPIRWVIQPEQIQVPELHNPRWDLFLILEANEPSQALITSLLDSSPYGAQGDFKIISHWTTTSTVPSRLLKDFLTTTNPNLLHPTSVPSLTGALDDPLLKPSSQDLSLTDSLRTWLGTADDPSRLPVRGAVSMFNLLAFKPDSKPSYLRYAKAFAETIGGKRGGTAKLFGNIVRDGQRVSEADQGVWHEFALAHYPSLLHFADMIGSKDYQEVNQTHRVGALADTCILCTSELEIEDLMGASQKAKL